jgi:4a-hydroxytetrahydrobiopterin dehydratase
MRRLRRRGDPAYESGGGDIIKADTGVDYFRRCQKIGREFEFKDFREAMTFINKVAEIAKTEGHHPDLCCFYNKVKLELWTHAINGLFENDFIVAAKVNELLR